MTHISKKYMIMIFYVMIDKYTYWRHRYSCRTEDKRKENKGVIAIEPLQESTINTNSGMETDFNEAELTHISKKSIIRMQNIFSSSWDARNDTHNQAYVYKFRRTKNELGCY